MKIILFVLALTVVPSAWSMTPQKRQAISAVRGADESWQTKVKFNGHESSVARGAPIQRTYAIDVAVPFEQADLSSVTRLPDYKTIEKYFVKVRDARFIEDPNEDMLRRITWLYPDDGCFARASLINKQLHDDGAPVLSKFYVFGNLEVQSPNAAYGSVTWWYHVAAAATDGKDVYIFDPAVEPMRPLKVQEWLGRLGTDPALAVAACNADTYTPYSDCYHPLTSEKDTDLEDTIYFLPFEKNRLQMLGRDWEKELGDAPPWLNKKVRRPKTSPRPSIAVQNHSQSCS